MFKVLQLRCHFFVFIAEKVDHTLKIWNKGIVLASLGPPGWGPTRKIKCFGLLSHPFHFLLLNPGEVNFPCYK